MIAFRANCTVLIIASRSSVKLLIRCFLCSSDLNLFGSLPSVSTACALVVGEFRELPGPV